MSFSMMFPCYSHDVRMKKPRMLASSASKWTLSTLGGSDTVSAQATTGGCSGGKPWLQWAFHEDRMRNSSNSQYWYIIKAYIDISSAYEAQMGWWYSMLIAMLITSTSFATMQTMATYNWLYIHWNCSPVDGGVSETKIRGNWRFWVGIWLIWS